MSKDEKIAELEERLKYIMSLDDCQAREAVNGLKIQIENGLRLVYKDLKEAETCEPTPDNYGLLLADLQLVFITLRRLGIDFD